MTYKQRVSSRKIRVQIVARKTRNHLEGPSTDNGDMTPVHISKQEFGRRVQRAMYAKGWHPSELARQANVRRDAVSTYIRGVYYPSPTNLHKIAKALGVDPEALLPNYAEQAIADAHPSIDLKVSPQRPSEAWLKVDRRVSLKTALAVTQLLNDDELPE